MELTKHQQTMSKLEVFVREYKSLDNDKERVDMDHKIRKFLCFVYPEEVKLQGFYFHKYNKLK